VVMTSDTTPWDHQLNEGKSGKLGAEKKEFEYKRGRENDLGRACTKKTKSNTLT